MNEFKLKYQNGMSENFTIRQALEYVEELNRGLSLTEIEINDFLRREVTLPEFCFQKFELEKVDPEWLIRMIGNTVVDDYWHLAHYSLVNTKGSVLFGTVYLSIFGQWSNQTKIEYYYYHGRLLVDVIHGENQIDSDEIEKLAFGDYLDYLTLFRDETGSYVMDLYFKMLSLAQKHPQIPIYDKPSISDEFKDLSENVGLDM